ncbi:hypothetical protein Ssi03_64610 [Sphaerisporangium siamense]|uniref:Quinol monooxygenase YgiN/uncharacterized membrane protein YhaH (DUF805 family) n=1 Tax=Sphaerisporangium siamense TaxID=795645 RepID=A0A7W7D2B0_9ACTN|nr:antibiotic biosynthesis monooxygenase [Sphaerisporangium siamense]MBB4699000.1 quinol monooxygenase YgiN/uncharacterized membrane protein YhaH (DUF805 family) [Sphaerisporangium siamense]GII88471.1 hypothetical protein Ssi03_64610 [Sphaerisporangium siamense]
MEALVAVTAFAGALFAAITTGILARRLRDERAGWLIAWTVTTAALCLALSAVAVGHLIGFGPVTFRVYQITGAFLAPFWLSIGMVQLLARGVAGRFAAWLLGIAFTLVTVVILAVDPLSAPEALAKKVLPLGDAHWTIIPTALLTAAHALTYLILIGCLIVAVLRWRAGGDSDADNMHAGVVLTPTGLAIVGAVRFAIPGVFAALVITLMVGAVWYAVARPLAPYDEERDDSDDWEEDPAPARRRGPEPSRPLQAPERPEATREAPLPPPAPAMPPPRRSGLGDLVAEYRAGDPAEVDYAARMQPGGFGGGPRTGEIIDQDQGRQGPVGRHGQHGPAGQPGQPGQHQHGQQEQGRQGQHGQHGQHGEQGGPGAFHEGGLPGQNGGRRAAGPPDYAMPGTGVVFPGGEGGGMFGHPDSPPAGRPAASPAAGSVKPSSGIYGLLTVFTLMDGAGEAFDRLAEETVEAVRRSEPDTLIFICHSVKSAPLQRIVYEIYRDEVAFTEHQRQAHMERFARERVAHVLAANVIELNVNAAKVVPLPSAFRV